MLELGLFLFGFILTGLILEWSGVKMWNCEDEENTDLSHK